MSRILRKPPVLRALLSNAVDQLSGKVISKSPKKESEKITEKAGVEIDKRMIDIQPIRTLGEHKAHVRLTIDIVPVINVLVHREGETPNIGGNAEEAVEEAVEEVVEAAAENTEA